VQATSTSSVDPNAAIVGEVDLPDPAATLSWSAPRWSKDGTRVVVERTRDARTWPWLDEHRADVGPALALFGLLLGFWWLVRTWRRPRIAGRAYCRRCNHDVGGAETHAERCGECGHALAGRGSVVGRTRSRRLGPTLALAALLVAGGAWLASGSIVGASAAAFRPRTAWPFAALDRFAGWPFWRADAPWIVVKRLDVFAVDAEGRPRHLPTSAIEPAPNAHWAMSDDGRMIAWTRFDETNGYRQEVCWFDVDANAGGSTYVGTNADGFLSMCGFGPDRRSIVVRRDRLVVVPDAVAAPDGATLGRHGAEVLRVDPDDGSWSVVGSADAFAIRQSDTSWMLEPGGAALGPGPRATWATFTLSRLRPPAASPYVVRVTSLTVGDGKDVRVVDVEGDAVALYRFVKATLVGDRELAIEEIEAEPQQPARDRRRYRIDLETGRAVVEPVPPHSANESAFEATIALPPGASPWLSPGDPPHAWARLVIRRR
jgi:hypothetical protein